MISTLVSLSKVYHNPTVYFIFYLNKNWKRKPWAGGECVHGCDPLFYFEVATKGTDIKDFYREKGWETYVYFNVCRIMLINMIVDYFSNIIFII